MSWDADLVDDRGHLDGEWNYTHNTNAMANAVLHGDDWQPVSTFDEVFRPRQESWWAVLNGMSGPEGAAFLARIIRGLEADPERFIAMNPENGWGDYHSFVEVLRDMHKSVPEWPTKWEVSG